MLDIKRCAEIFPASKVIYIVSWKNECKEVLIDSESGASLEKICVVDIDDRGAFRIEEFKLNDILLPYEGAFIEMDNFTDLFEEGWWIYEPSPGLMKTGAWNAIAKKYGVTKFSRNCHLFASNKLQKDFPGRITRLESIMDKKQLKKLNGLKRNVVVRNYPLKADVLSAKLKVIPGGNSYIYGVTVGVKEKPVIIETIPFASQ